MRSATGSRGDRGDDLSTRARIRDAAIRLFGRDGYDGTSVRAVAAAAGVSPALVIHHFGSKEGVRAACDAHMVATFIDRTDDLAGPGASARIQEWLRDIEAFRPSIDYLARMLTEPGAASDAVFDALLAGTRAMLDGQRAAGVVRDSSDPDVIAAVVTAYGVVPLLLGHHLARVLGEDDLGEPLIRRLTAPILELYTHGLYADDRLLHAARAALAPGSGAGPDVDDHEPRQDPDPPSAAR